MIVQRPSFSPLVKFSIAQGFMEQFEKLQSVSAGIGVYGPAAAYALVWELGARSRKQTGPKTVWGVNRFGERVIMSSQSPMGYVGIASNQFWPVIKQHLDNVEIDLSSARNTQLNLEVAMDNAAQAIARIVADIAPVDSGDLRSEILGVDSDEVDFLDDASDDETDGVLFL